MIGGKKIKLSNLLTFTSYYIQIDLTFDFRLRARLCKGKTIASKVSKLKYIAHNGEKPRTT